MIEEDVITQLYLNGIECRKQYDCMIEQVSMRQSKLVLLFTGRGVASSELSTITHSAYDTYSTIFGTSYSVDAGLLVKSNYYAHITKLTMKAPNVSIYIIADPRRTKLEITEILEECIFQALLVSAQTTPESLPSERTLGNNLNELII